MNKPTCGSLFTQVFEEALKLSDEPLDWFSWGHLCGQAEKVYLGACPAMMVRPNDAVPGDLTPRLAMQARVTIIANIYTLVWTRLQTSRGIEYWLYQPRAQDLIDELMTTEENSPHWHTIRGILCGIPKKDIDTEFHKRYAPASHEHAKFDKST